MDNSLMVFKNTSTQKIFKNGKLVSNEGYDATYNSEDEDPLVIDTFKNDDSYKLIFSQDHLNKFVNQMISHRKSEKSLQDRLKEDFSTDSFIPSVSINDRLDLKNLGGIVKPIINIRYHPIFNKNNKNNKSSKNNKGKKSKKDKKDKKDKNNKSRRKN